MKKKKERVVLRSKKNDLKQKVKLFLLLLFYTMKHEGELIMNEKGRVKYGVFNKIRGKKKNFQKRGGEGKRVLD